MSQRVLHLVIVLGLLPGAALAADGRYMVKFADAAQGKAAVFAAGGKIALELGPQRVAAVYLPASAVAALEKSPHVEYVEDDPRRFPSAQSVPYGIDMVQAPLAWPLATGVNRTVCVIDSGFYVGHQDLQSAGVSGYPAGWDKDGCGHGSHVSGTIAALNNADGVVGVLPNGVNLHMVKVFGDDCSWTYSSGLVDALNRCRSAGANVVSMSLGGSFKSITEQRAFNDAYAAGVLSVAAAGNGGNTTFSYPASYSSVISVAAVDSAKQHASFSQRNSQVELAAPGVAVLSTVPWLESNSLTVDGASYQANYVDGAARTAGVLGALVDGGLCDSVGSFAGAVVLCQRGTISFLDKVKNVQAGGGAAAVIYNNAPGNFFGTLGTGNTSAIPAISLSQEDGQFLVSQKLGLSGTVVSLLSKPASGYEAWDGTSMATPHVSGVAALVWSYNSAWTNEQIRKALQATAEDLGDAGKDNSFGYGLVQAKAALDYLINSSGGSGGFSLNAVGYKSKGQAKVDLSWSGAASASVDVYRNGSLVATTANDGAHTDSLGRVTGTFTYKLCEAGTATCSNESTVTF
ncbi:MAG: S8 family serine peptidase [Myxococcales bacterium]|nr:S8 family serine peptidase [Myxococcales bacterium]